MTLHQIFSSWTQWLWSRSRRPASCFCSLPAALLAVSACCGLVGTAGEARGEVITASSFQIDIASNIDWMDNNTMQSVVHTVARQTTMQSFVSERRPTLRITNNSSTVPLMAAAFDISRLASSVEFCEWLDHDGLAAWSIDQSRKIVDLEFSDPILPGDSVSLMIATQAEPFASLRSQPIFTTSNVSRNIAGGEVSLRAGTAVTDPDRVGIVGSPSDTLRFDFGGNGDTVFNADATAVGVRIGDVAAVPEPGSLAIVGSAAAVFGFLRFHRRRARAPWGNLGKQGNS